VGLTFDASVAWPAYDWMGVAKAGLASCARYLARDLGPRGHRVNLVAAGPLETLAAKAIPGFEALQSTWDTRAPLGWDQTDQEPAARAVVALLSDLFPATTGEIVHVDGGFHAIGA
jgi:enoyl-[acyl-carrier protein] reductase I